MNHCMINVQYVGPGIENEYGVITFEGDIETLEGKQRGVIDAPPQTTIHLHCHKASFVVEEPVVWLSHGGHQPHWIEKHHDSPDKLRLIVGDLEEKDMAKFLVNLNTEDGELTSKDPTIVSEPVNLPPTDDC